MSASRLSMGLVGAAMAAAAAVALPADAYLRLVAAALAATIVLLMTVALVDRLNLTLLALMCTAVAFPVEFRGPGGAQVSTSLPLAAGLCALWVIRCLIARDASGFDRSGIVVAAMTLAASTVVSFVIGQFPWFPSSGAPLPAQMAQLGLFLVSVALFLAVGHQVRRLRELQWLTWLFVAAGAVTCVIQMIPQLSALGRLTTRPGSVGSLFWTWLMAVCVSQGFINRTLPRSARLGLIGLAALVLFHGLVQTRSWASGWIPPSLAAGLILVTWRPRLTIGLAMAAVPLGLLVAGDLVREVLVEETYSLSTRQEAWRVLWQIVERSPLLGTGLANYYYFAENFPILGWYVPFISHNNYQDLLVETGLVGLLAFLWFGLEAVWLTFRLSRQLPPGFPTAYAVGAFGGTVGSLASGMLGDWIIPFYYNAGIIGFRSSLLFWVFLGGALSLRRMRSAAAPARTAAHALMRVSHGPYSLVPSR